MAAVTAACTFPWRLCRAEGQGRYTTTPTPRSQTAFIISNQSSHAECAELVEKSRERTVVVPFELLSVSVGASIYVMMFKELLTLDCAMVQRVLTSMILFDFNGFQIGGNRCCKVSSRWSWFRSVYVVIWRKKMLCMQVLKQQTECIGNRL